MCNCNRFASVRDEAVRLGAFNPECLTELLADTSTDPIERIRFPFFPNDRCPVLGDQDFDRRRRDCDDVLGVEDEDRRRRCRDLDDVLGIEDEDRKRCSSRED